ncbi:MAG: response regulator [Pseudomonadota bacterium]
MSKPVILCVDDEQTVLDSLEIELHKALGNDYRIEFADSGEDALALIEELLEKSYEIAVVIADYLMPNIKGDELLKRIHARLPKTLNIMLTGQANLEAVADTINYAKLYGYITKPWQAEDLRRTVKDALYSYRQEKMLAEQNAKLQHLDNLKNELIANVSHELRTPLNGILGLSEFLSDQTGLSKKHRELISILVQSAHRLNNTVNDLLDFSKLKRKNIDLKLKPVNMQKMSGILLSLHETQLDDKNLKLINAVPDNLSLAWADENRVQQILHHLIGNAIKFTQRGSIEVSAEVVNRNIDREIKTPLDPKVLEKVEYPKLGTVASDFYVAITVSDTGIGIPADKFDRLFKSFEQLDGSSTRRYEGTGLGLNLTKQLLELQNGAIFVESTVGTGSRFTFILPVADATVNKDAQKATPTLPPFKILIVDDDPLTLQLFVMYLSSPEYAITTATSGLEALAKLEEGLKPDLILLDVIMPVMNGYDLTLKIRETWSANELPVLLVSAKSEVSNVVSGLEIGANDYIRKPVNKKELLARITTHLTRGRLDTENSLAAMVFQSSHVGIVITDAHVNIIKVNQAFLDLFGCRVEEVLGQNPSIVASGEHGRSFFQTMWNTILTNGCWYGKITNSCKDGKTCPCWLSVSAVKDKHNKLTHYIGFLGAEV